MATVAASHNNDSSEFNGTDVANAQEAGAPDAPTPPDRCHARIEGHGADEAPEVAVIMGSASDWETMRHACCTLERFGVAYSKQVISAHRTPELMAKFAHEARRAGIKVIIAGAGGAAHLPGMVAAQTTLPVIGVPVQSHALSGWDSLLSIVQMPGGIPVATTAIGNSGATNAALLAVSILGLTDAALADQLQDYRDSLKEKVAQSNAQLI